MNGVMKVLGKADSILASILKTICTVSLITVFLIYILNVVIRFMPVTNLKATDEIVEMLSAWIVFFGAAELLREGKHFVVDMFVQKVEGKPIEKVIKLIVFAFSMIFISVMFYYGLDLVIRATSVSTTLRIPKRVFYVCIPISAFIMGVYLIRDIIVTFLPKKIK